MTVVRHYNGNYVIDVGDGNLITLPHSTTIDDINDKLSIVRELYYDVTKRADYLYMVELHDSLFKGEHVYLNELDGYEVNDVFYHQDGVTVRYTQNDFQVTLLDHTFHVPLDAHQFEMNVNNTDHRITRSEHIEHLALIYLKEIVLYVHNNSIAPYYPLIESLDEWDYLK